MPTNPAHSECKECGKWFVGKRKLQLYCSRKCNNNAYVKLLREKRKENPSYGKKSKSAKCKQCQKTFNHNQTKELKFCSRECSGIFTRVESQPPFTNVYFNNCGICNSVHCTKSPCKKACTKCADKYSKKYKKLVLSNRTVKTCPKCSCNYSPLPGYRKFKCCSSQCSSKMMIDSTRRRKILRDKRIKNSLNLEIFNPFEVFNRDKWKCQCCSKKLKQDDRGKMIDKAPELDHIIPLSKGGEHNRRNTQLLCRKCNGAKSNNGYEGEQMLLVG